MTVNRTHPPQAGAMHITAFPEVLQDELHNGIPVYIIPFGREDLTEIQFVYKAGHAYESKTGLASLTARMMQEGNRSYDSLGFAEILDFYGASLDIEAGYESSSFSLVTLTKHLDKTMELMQEMLYHPSFPVKEFQLHIQRSLQQIQVEEQKTSYVARKNFASNLFGSDHPYGAFVGKEALQQIEHADLPGCYHTYFRPGPAFILCAGRFDRETLMDTLNNTIGKMTYHKSALTSAAEEKLFTSKVGTLSFPVKDSMQSSIRAGLPSISRSHADYYRLQMTMLILGGYFGSRLMKNIREDKGYTYGIGASLNGLKHAGYCSIATDVAHEYVKPVIQEILNEITKMKNEPVSIEELDTARNYLFGVYMARRETLFQIGEQVKNARVNDLNIHDMNRVFSEIQNLTPEDIQICARKYLNSDNLLWVVAGTSL
jgi:zinc protease